MAVKEFGQVQSIEAPRNYAKELTDLAGDAFPMSLQQNTKGELTGISYETEWTEGSSEPITDKDGKTVDYKIKSKKRKLTKIQTEKIDSYIEKHLVTE